MPYDHSVKLFRSPGLLFRGTMLFVHSVSQGKSGLITGKKETFIPAGGDVNSCTPTDRFAIPRMIE